MKIEWLSADKRLCVKRKEGYRDLYFDNKHVATQYRIKGEARTWAKSKIKQQLKSTTRWMEKTEDEASRIRKELIMWNNAYQTVFN